MWDLNMLRISRVWKGIWYPSDIQLRSVLCWHKSIAPTVKTSSPSPRAHGWVQMMVLSAAAVLLAASLRHKSTQRRSSVLVRKGIVLTRRLESPWQHSTAPLWRKGSTGALLKMSRIGSSALPAARRADSLCRMRRLPSCLYSASHVGYAVHARPESNCVTLRSHSPRGKIFVLTTVRSVSAPQWWNTPHLQSSVVSYH